MLSRGPVDGRGHSRLSALQQQTLRVIELLQVGDRGAHLYNIEQAMGRSVGSGLLRTLRALARWRLVEEYVANPDHALLDENVILKWRLTEVGRRHLPYLRATSVSGEDIRRAAGDGS